MQELTDDQLDGLFRKSAEEFDTPLDPAAWKAMESRLDAHDRTKPGPSPISKYLLRLGLPVLLLVSTGITWFVYHHQQRSTASAVVTESVSTAGKATAPVVSDEQPAKPKANQLRDVEPGRSDDRQSAEAVVAKGPEAKYEPSITETSVTEHGTLNTKEVKSPSSGDASGPIATIPSATPTDKAATKKRESISHSKLMASTTSASTSSKVYRNRNRVLVRSPKVQRTRTAKKADDVRASLFASSGYEQSGKVPSKQRRSLTNEPGLPVSTVTSSDQPVADVEFAGPVTLPALTELAGKSAVWLKPVLAINRDVVVKPDTTQRITSSKPSLPVQKGLSVRFVVSPDLSTIGLRDFSRPGTNVGLMLEYRLASRWSIQAGVLRSTKVYRASTDFYELPAYTKNWAVQPEGVSGQCNMIDIPINLRYDILLRPAANGKGVNRWFMSGGTTSYIMRQEDYDYEYADPSNPHIYPDRRGWHGNSGSYGFSQLNMSVGYERAFSRRLSWQIEPFMKMPLKKIGYYKLDLLSTGAFLSLRYKL